MKDRSMAIKHAKARKEALKEMLSNQNSFAVTSWGTNEMTKRWFYSKPYSVR
jgi:hypothetical protein